MKKEKSRKQTRANEMGDNVAPLPAHFWTTCRRALDEDEASVSVQSCLFASSSCVCVVRR